LLARALDLLPQACFEGPEHERDGIQRMLTSLIQPVQEIVIVVGQELQKLRT